VKIRVPVVGAADSVLAHKREELQPRVRAAQARLQAILSEIG